MQVTKQKMLVHAVSIKVIMELHFLSTSTLTRVFSNVCYRKDTYPTCQEALPTTGKHPIIKKKHKKASQNQNIQREIVPWTKHETESLNTTMPSCIHNSSRLCSYSMSYSFTGIMS